MLYGLEGKNEARLISTSTTKSTVRAAAFCDALAKFYAGPPPAPGTPFAAFQRPAPPIGMADNGKLAEDTPVLKAVLEKKTADGKPAYSHTIVKLNDTADPVALIRNAFTAQNDENCEVVLARPATNLVKVLDLPGTVDLIKHKVRFLVFAAGSYPRGARTSTSRATWLRHGGCSPSGRLPSSRPGPRWARCCLFPVPRSRRISRGRRIIRSWMLIGLSRRCRTMRPRRPWRRCCMRCIRTGTSSCRTRARSACWTTAGLSSRPLPKAAIDTWWSTRLRSTKVIQTYVEMASAKPVPRAPRFRGGQKKQADPPKVAEPVKKQ